MPSISSSVIKGPLFKEASKLHMGLISDQTTVLTGGTVLFAREVYKTGDITRSGSRFTLPANGSYELKATCGPVTATSGGIMNYGWYNVTAGGYILGSFGYSYPATSGYNSFTQGLAGAMITVGWTPIQVEVRISSEVGIDRLSYNNSWCTITKIDTKIPIGFASDHWEDLRFPATAINPPGLGSDPTFDTTNIGWSFSAPALEFLFMVAQLPHSYKQGSPLRAHVHWEPSTTNAGNVVWLLSYRWRNNGETAVAMTDVYITVPANGTALTLQLDGFAEIAKTNATISSMLDIKLSRVGTDGADTFTGAAIMKEFDIHYLKDSSGSISEYTK